MMKKIQALILAFIITLSCINTVQAAGNAVYEQDSAVEFLSMLGIVIDQNTDMQAAITRAEFADILIRSMNLEPANFRSGVFSDVFSTTSYSGSIIKAYDMGIVSGGNMGLYYPDSPLTLEAALKMTVTALDYTALAAAYGGYPSGYMRIANELDLLDGIAADSDFTYADAVFLIFNFLQSDMCRIDAITEDGFIRARDIGRSPLTVFFGLELAEGVIKTAGYVTMIPGFECTQAQISVDGYHFKTDIDGAEKYLGLSARVWYDKSTNIVKAILPDYSNKSVTVNIEDVESFDSSEIISFEETKQKEQKFRLSPSFTLVKNGRPKSPSSEQILANTGELILIDNNGDGAYDVVHMRSAQYLVASYIDAVNGIIYDTSSGSKSLVLDNENANHYSLKISDKDGNLSAAVAADISSGMVITYYCSDDGSYTEAIANSHTLSAVVDERSDDSVTINGESYKVNIYFGSISKLIPGLKYTLLLAYDGTITAISSKQKGTMEYGFFIDYAINKSGVTTTSMMAILTTGNKVIYPELEEKITLDGKKGVACDSPEISNKLKPGDVPAYQVIKYALSDDDKITKIDTAEIIEEKNYNPSVLSDNDIGDNTLTRQLHNKQAFWHGSYGLLAPFALVGAGTVMFSAPSDLCTNPTKKYNEDDFSVITAADLPSYESKIPMSFYDLNKNLQPAAVVMYNGITGGNVTVSTSVSPAIVKAVTVGINADGDTTAIFSYYQNGRSYKMPLNVEKYISVTNAGLPGSGDIIRIATNSDGEIASFVIDVSCTQSQSGAASLDISSSAPSGGTSDHSWYTGTSYIHSSSTITLIVEDHAYNSGRGDDIAGGITGLNIGSGCSIVLYDTKTHTAKPGNLSMIADAISVGEDNASHVAIKCYNQTASSIFIYK